MNPGLSEEAGSTARTAIDALKSTPAVLCIVIFNLAFMGLIGWSSYQNGARWERVMMQAFEACKTKG